MTTSAVAPPADRPAAYDLGRRIALHSADGQLLVELDAAQAFALASELRSAAADVAIRVDLIAHPIPTQHTCNPKRPGKPLPFGRRAPAGECARCDELHQGAEPRALAWADARTRSQREDEQRAAAIRDHFAPGGTHQTRCAGTVCTFGDW